MTPAAARCLGSSGIENGRLVTLCHSKVCQATIGALIQVTGDGPGLVPFFLVLTCSGTGMTLLSKSTSNNSLLVSKATSLSLEVQVSH